MARQGTLESPEVLEDVPGHIIPIIHREFDDFDNEAHKFLDGKTPETEFIGFRLKQGVYGQRQADVQMVRIKLPFGGITPEEEASLDDIAAEISTFERRAMAAERETVDRLIAHHLANRVGEEFDGRVGGVTKSGLFIGLPEFGADGFIPISTLGNDYYIYDEAHQALVGDRTGLGYRLGDSVKVKLVEAVPLAGALRFEMLSEGRELPRGMRSFHKSGRGATPVRKKPGTRAPRGRK